MATHQGPTQEWKQLSTYADKVSDQLIKQFKKPIVLCYTGMSGTALATATFIALNQKKFKYTIGMIFVRKEDEPSNSGNKLHHHNGELIDDAEYIFVDDQIGKGKTFKRVEDGIRQVMPSRPPVCYEDDPKKKWDAFRFKWMTLKCYGLHEILPKAEGQYGFGSYVTDRVIKPLSNKHIYGNDFY